MLGGLKNLIGARSSSPSRFDERPEALCDSCRKRFEAIIVAPWYHGQLCFDVQCSHILSNFSSCLSCFRLMLSMMELFDVPISSQVYEGSWRPTAEDTEIMAKQTIKLYLYPHSGPDQPLMYAMGRYRQRLFPKDERNIPYPSLVGAPTSKMVTGFFELFQQDKEINDDLNGEHQLSSIAQEMQRLPSASLLNPGQVNDVRQWLHWCDTQHQYCDRSTRGQSKSDNPRLRVMPRRLIEVDGPCGRLINTLPGQDHTYATLSHCWGDNTFQTLTRRNCDKLGRRIDPAMLTRTFREAVDFCRLLHIKYLWIDSLCIMQDDPYDLEQEISIMDRIYANCFVNLAATASSDGRQGLFRSFLGTASASAHIDGQTYLRQNHTFHARAVAMCSPLLRRGWVVQELALSPRTIHFTVTGMILQCKDSIHIPGQSVLSKGFRNLVPIFAKISSIGNESVSDFDDTWHRITEHFSQTSVRLPQDRALAIAGLATYLGQQYSTLGLNSRYFAGCWSHNAYVWLLWARKQEPRSMENSRDSLQTALEDGRQAMSPAWSTQALVAPTWSWLSAGPNIMFPAMSRKWRGDTVVDTIEVVEMNLDFRFAEISAGPVDRGRLLLRAHWLRAVPSEDKSFLYHPLRVVRTGNQDVNAFSTPDLSNTLNDRDCYETDVAWDTYSGHKATTGVYILIIGVRSRPALWPEWENFYQGLVCTLSSEQDMGQNPILQRCGFFQFRLLNNKRYTFLEEARNFWLQ